MKLNDIPDVPAPRDAKAVQPAPHAQADKAERADAAVKADRVSSDRADKARALAQAAAQASAAGRSARLMEIAAAVKQGTYSPDPARIAQEILNDAEVTARIEAMLRA